MNTWTCIVWVPNSVNVRSLDEFVDGYANDLPPDAFLGFQTLDTGSEYRFKLDADGEDKLRVRVGRLSQAEQVGIRCEFDGVAEEIFVL